VDEGVAFSVRFKEKPKKKKFSNTLPTRPVIALSSFSPVSSPVRPNYQPRTPPPIIRSPQTGTRMGAPLHGTEAWLFPAKETRPNKAPEPLLAGRDEPERGNWAQVPGSERL